MLGAIVLRDIPKKEARIDLVGYQIQGGFRGFSMVPPAIWHYVSVEAGGRQVGFWCNLKPKQVIVKMFDPAEGFREADAEIQAQYSDLALSGSMGPALIGYPMARVGAWMGLVDKIGKDNFPPPLHEVEAGAGSRFDKVFQSTHGGNGESLLEELQYAFMRWLVSIDSGAEDEIAFGRWRHLVLSAYNAGEDRIRETGDLFLELVDVLMRQFDVLPADWFSGESFLVSNQAGYMSEDMIDTEIAALAEKGELLIEYLKRRGEGS